MDFLFVFLWRKIVDFSHELGSITAGEKKAVKEVKAESV